MNAEAFPVVATFRVKRSDNRASSIMFLLPWASGMKRILCFDWLCERYWTYARYKATKTENLLEASESRSSGKGFRQIITLDMIFYKSDLYLRSQTLPFISLNDVWRRKLPVFWMLGAWIRVFRHLENTQKSQNFDRASQVQEKGETKGEII